MKLSKIEIQHELWRRGELRFLYHNGQHKIDKIFRSHTGNFFVLRCSRRFGKTFWLVTKALEVLLNCKNKFPRVKLATKTLKDLKEFILPVLQIILESAPSDLPLEYVKSEHKILNHANGGELALYGLDRNPDGGRGAYVDFYGIDEARNVESELLRYLWQSVISPMTANRPGVQVIFSSSAPHSAAHSFHSIFTPLAMETNSFVDLNIFDAPHISPAERDRLLKACLDETTRAREYYNQIVADEDLAIVLPSEQKGIITRKIERPPYFELCPKYVAMDLGTKRDLTAILFGYWDPVKEWFVLEGEEQVTGPKLTTKVILDLVKSREKELWGDAKVHLRVADNNNALLLQDLNILHDLYFMATTKERTLVAMVNNMREFIQNRRLVVDENACPFTLGSLKYGCWDKNRSKWDYSKVYGHYDHLAALMYLIRNIDQTHDESLAFTDTRSPDNIAGRSAPKKPSVLQVLNPWNAYGKKRT